MIKITNKEVHLLDHRNIFIENKGNPKDFMLVRKIGKKDIIIRSSTSLVVIDKNELLGVLMREDL